MSNRHAAAAIALGLLLVLPGCAAFRAQVGYGFGAGATVKLPGLVQTGLAFGFWRHTGPDYHPRPVLGAQAADADLWDVVATWPFKLKHAEGVRRMRDYELVELSGAERDPHNYDTWMLLPLDLVSGPYTYQHWPLELDVGLVAVDFRLGVNPYFLFHGSEPEAREFVPGATPGRAGGPPVRTVAPAAD